jgi:cell division protein FtsB
MARRTRTSFAREAYYVACVVIFIASAIFTIWGPGGFQDMKKAERQLMSRRQRVTDLQNSNAGRLRKIQDLKGNKNEMERLARDKGYARAGEIIQNLPPAKPEASATPQPEKHR